MLQARWLVFVFLAGLACSGHGSTGHQIISSQVFDRSGARAGGLGSRPAARFISLLYRFKKPQKKHFCTGKTPVPF
jgi:hypothetical protein